MERPSGVSSARLERCGRGRQFLQTHAGQRDELGGLAVAVGDRPGLVEQQRVDIACGLDGTTGHRQHVALHEAIHAGDADGREQGADRRRDQTHEEGDEDDDGLLVAGVDGEGLQRDHRKEKDDRQPGEEDVEGDLVRRLLALGALDEGDHAVEERLARPRRDAHDDLVGEHPRAARHRRAIPTGLADDRGRLPRDRRLVDGGDPLDDVAVARDHLAGGDDTVVADTQGAAGDRFDRPVSLSPAGHRVLPRLAQGGRLRLAAPFGHRLGEVGEQHGEPQECGDEGAEDVLAGVRVTQIPEEEDRRHHASDEHDEHHRIACLLARVQLAHAVDQRPADDVAVDHLASRQRVPVARRRPDGTDDGAHCSLS